MASENNGEVTMNGKTVFSRTTSDTMRGNYAETELRSFKIDGDSTSSFLRTSRGEKDFEDESNNKYLYMRSRQNTVDIGSISRRFLESPADVPPFRMVQSELQTPSITEGTPASEAIKANASIKVTKLDKLGRKIKGNIPAKKFFRHAAMRSKKTKRGKPPRVPHHPIHWKRDLTNENEGGISYGEEDLREKYQTPVLEVNYHQSSTLRQASELNLQPDLQATPNSDLEEQHERKRRHRRRRKKKKKRAYVKGKVIDGEHELYTLSIAVMLGLRTSIGMTNGQLSETSKSPTMWLTNDDFMTVEKYAFRPKGGPKTPPHVLSHTFKFKDYSPKAFAYIRRMFGVNEYDFLSSVCGNANFIEFISNAKSGQFFFYSSDGKYMIKTMTNAESKFLRRILPHYFRHCSQNPNTLLVHFFGMYRVKMYHLRRNTKFVIMNSVFDTDKYLDTFFDLKGSVTGRDARPNDDVKKDNDVRRDLPNTSLSLYPEAREKLRKQLESDCAFLSAMKIMDYSMLIGVHHIPVGKSSSENFTSTFIERDSVSLRNILAKRSKSINPIIESTPSEEINNEKYQLQSNPNNITDSFSEAFLGPELRSKQYCHDRNFNDPNPFMSMSGPPGAVALDLDFEEDDDSYLDGDQKASTILDSDQTFTPETNIEIRKLQAAEQVYWPFQRFYDSDGRRRMIKVAFPNIDKVESFGLPEFITPISNRKDAGLLMDISQRKLPLPISSSVTKPQNLTECSGKIFYLGIIDILQQFNIRKRFEARYRRIKGGGWADASCVHPVLYADRFLRFFDEYTKQYGTIAMEKEEINEFAPTNEDSMGAKMFTLDDISDDEENVETIVFFDQNNKNPTNGKLEVRSNKVRTSPKQIIQMKENGKADNSF